MNICRVAMARKLSFLVFWRAYPCQFNVLRRPFPGTMKQDNSIWQSWQEILSQSTTAIQVAQYLGKSNLPVSYFCPSKNSVQLQNKRAFLGWCLLHCEVHMSHPGVLLKCRLWFSGSRKGLSICISNKLPGEANAAGPVASLCTARLV